ncbi:VOC family protein [Nonomuraea rosea]
MGLRIGALVVDSHDPGRLARFWAEALGWVISRDEDPEWVVEPAEGSREDCVVADLLFIKVPEPKAGKNRLHFDLRPEHQSAEVARLEGLGATRVDVGQGDEQAWVVMADPEGNEFCVQDAHSPQVRAEWLRRYGAYEPVFPGHAKPGDRVAAQPGRSPFQRQRRSVQSSVFDGLRVDDLCS